MLETLVIALWQTIAVFLFFAIIIALSIIIIAAFFIGINE